MIVFLRELFKGLIDVKGLQRRKRCFRIAVFCS